ncbi:hypothetical protein FOZ61_007704 [Perkinsus olseni]|uniref:N-acetyltransferase domain-containing protein n=1 Tax=Perkinsus olseni TaxID=32597 RepID=A0A7J6MQH3_PEROL|nr:hypothetical protein FOZ61_007704 [Perkinsus olseni]KAF4673490.1 hypothetical protein FOL46_007099 [Perkinsus olseni]
MGLPSMALGSWRRLMPGPLKYRLANPADEIKAVRDYPDSAFFVAVDDSETVVGSVEFGVVKNSKLGDWVYVTNAFAHDGYKRKGVEAEILRNLLEYIHEKNPGVVGAWTRVYCDDGDRGDDDVFVSEEAIEKAYLDAGFTDRGESRRAASS